jgi:hypothetical protein
VEEISFVLVRITAGVGVEGTAEGVIGITVDGDMQEARSMAASKNATKNSLRFMDPYPFYRRKPTRVMAA